MRLIIYDCEVFAHDWLVIFKDHETGHYTSFVNDNEGLKAFVEEEEAVFVGFNSKHYDQYIIKAICQGYTQEEIKEVSDFVIDGYQGWQHPLLQGSYIHFNDVDIRDDMQMGLSLKAIEGHLGLPIRESTIPFDLARPLRDQEMHLTVHYCRHDVDTTERIVEIRKDYLRSKIMIGKLADIPEAKAMGMTNAKLTAAILKARKKEHDDERNYQYPPNLKLEYIPSEVFEFFDRMRDELLLDEEIFGSKLTFQIGECSGIISFGGIHAAIPNYFFEQDNGRVIRNKDVASYYPHLMKLYEYTSRNIPSPETFENVLEKRMQAKASGDKATANALKLVVNTTFGAMLNQYNDLHDPLMGRSVCISGQLFLLELARHLHDEIEDLKIVQLNTDGIMLECDECDLPEVDEICGEWQVRTGFELEEDSIVRLAQKDVNNYVEVQPDGTSKAKGGYLVKGISTAGAFNINNSCCIVAAALHEYFVNGTPVKDTVNDCNDIFKFQIIAKAGTKYREAYHLIDGEQVAVQKVNRVYATKDTRYGKLYKVKAENSSTAKIESLPDHCVIDNENELTIYDVDKDYYIELANKRINDFKGIKPEKKTRRKKEMATAKTEKEKVLNVYQKLLQARSMFLAEAVQKGGKNMHLEFKYFELDDIVPPATRIFEQVGLIPVVNIGTDVASMMMIDTEAPEPTIEFTAPFTTIEANKATNSMQALGASITYMRRYLYMLALDICEPDAIDGNLGADKPTLAPKANKAPATPTQRQEVAKNLTAKDDLASPLQIKQLKAVLKSLKAADPEKEEMIAKIALETEGLTIISKRQCETIIKKVLTMLEEKEKGEE